MLIVQKYGGTSVQDPQRLAAAADRAIRLRRQGARVVLVVSAQGDTTDELIAKAREVNSRPEPRELDACISAGEQISAALMAMTIAARGGSAVSLTGGQAGIHTDRAYGNARILQMDTRRIRQELDAGKIVVAAGFQGVDADGNVTTLGRGGSDTTAVALAAALGADRCQIFTDVDGVYDRDPRRDANAVRFSRIRYADMLRLAESGAQVLHDRCIELARDHGIELEVLSAFTGAPGTVVQGTDTVRV